MSTEKADTAADLLALLRERNIADEAQCQALGEAMPGPLWLTSLQALGAWVAALLVSLGMMVGGLMSEAPGVFATLLIGAALWLFHAYRHSPFADQMALGLSLAGQLVLASAWGLKGHEENYLLNMLIAMALAAWLRTSLLHRSACLVIAIWCIYHDFFQYWPQWVALFLTALAAVLWLARRYWAVWPQAPYAAALAHAVTLSALVALWLFHIGYLTGMPLFRLRGQISAYHLYPWGVALAWLACTFWLARALPWAQRRWLLGVALALAAIGWRAPALLLSLSLMLATFAACARAWFAATLLCAGLFLGIFYYSLEQTLLLKSATLAGAGLAFLGLGWLARRLQQQSQPQEKP